jgi:hypothetical protein
MCNRPWKYTVDILLFFSPETGESAQLRFALKSFGRNSSDLGEFRPFLQPKNLLFWGNFAQIERNSPEILGAKLNCADSPISGEKNNNCVCQQRMNEIITGLDF